MLKNRTHPENPNHGPPPPLPQSQLVARHIIRDGFNMQKMGSTKGAPPPETLTSGKTIRDPGSWDQDGLDRHTLRIVPGPREANCDDHTSRRVSETLLFGGLSLFSASLVVVVVERVCASFLSLYVLHLGGGGLLWTCEQRSHGTNLTAVLELRGNLDTPPPSVHLYRPLACMTFHARFRLPVRLLVRAVVATYHIVRERGIAVRVAKGRWRWR